MQNPDIQKLTARIPRIGYVYVVFAAVLWASSGTAAKFLFLNKVSPFQLIQLRTTISAVFLYLWLFTGKPGILKIERKDLLYFFLLGLTLAVAQFTYLYAISRINVAAAILLQYQAPVLIAGYALFFTRRRPSLSTFLALIGAVSGCYFMVGGYNMDIVTISREGIISGLVSALFFAIYSVQSEKGMRSYSPWTVVFYALFFAAIIWNLIEPPFIAFTVSYGVVSWAWICFISVFGTVLAFGLYNEGIKLIFPTHASITATLEPVVAGVISFVLLGEILESLQIAGAGLVVVSILVLQLRRDPNRGK
jgi:drug/metabolite transporter, DME family